jgi:putative aminopeptidase FrvX
MINLELLEKLCSIPGTSGDESGMKSFLIDWFKTYQRKTNVELRMITEGIQDNLIVIIGKPETLVLAHMDTVGYTVRYTNQLIPVGGPVTKSGDRLVGQDGLGPIECTFHIDEEKRCFYEFGRAIERGTPLSYQPDFRIDENWVQSPYLDNRLGIFTAISALSAVSDVALGFTCWEEHGGGSVPLVLSILKKELPIRQALISDITWVTDGISFESGPVISMRDRNIPRRTFIQRIMNLASHTPREKASISDIQWSVELYAYLINHLSTPSSTQP